MEHWSCTRLVLAPCHQYVRWAAFCQSGEPMKHLLWEALTPGTSLFLPEAVPHQPDFYFYCFVWHVGACPGPPCLGKDSVCPTPTPSPAIWHCSSIPSGGRAHPAGSPAPTSADLGCSWVVCIPPAPRMLMPTTDADLRLWISSTGHGGETGTELVTQPPKNQIPAQIHSPKLSWHRGESLCLTCWVFCG